MHNTIEAVCIYIYFVHPSRASTTFTGHAMDVHNAHMSRKYSQFLNPLHEIQFSPENDTL